MTQQLKMTPTTLRQANQLVSDKHRHHEAAHAHRWSIGVSLAGKLVGAAICARPVGRRTPQYTVLEVTRLVSDGTPHVCSKLYAAAARIAQIMGFDRVQTFILKDEPGTSLKAAGWEFSHMTNEDASWDRPSRSRKTRDLGQKQCWIKKLRAEGTE